ncbi:hypothetical protein R1flu_019703 [Riccia fluitans]|uniref:Uncharacterized protein n=1 Tax=Riccia fluitans TaxID=41844 RepID=A0ABD1ZKU7_9MARC
MSASAWEVNGGPPPKGKKTTRYCHRNPLNFRKTCEILCRLLSATLTATSGPFHSQRRIGLCEMDLGDRNSMDIIEAAHVMKQSTSTPSTGTNPAPVQTPPLMMMQQAVAMQQFQFQQALLMQQVMATQQAAARAASVKSAAEMAAARAAEISKQLKGADAEDEEKKPECPQRSKSRSPSRSRSVSRSKSRSPIRYRRDRSHSRSRSPIRYRRDRPYSPSRSRDYYSYRSRSRRGYYRGRGDYPWNHFRRDWDRQRDRDYYPRPHRSRSRSRSRVRRRSRSRSRTPRFRRERSVSPRNRRDERRHTRSRELERTPSAASSRSPSASPPKEKSRSPSKRQEEIVVSPVLPGASYSPAPEVGGREDRNLSRSPVEHDEISQLMGPSFKGEEQKTQASGSPQMSPSVSPKRFLRAGLEPDDEEVHSSSRRKASSIVCQKGDDETGDVPADEADVCDPSQLKGSGSDISSEVEKVEEETTETFRGNLKVECSSKDVEFLTGVESEDDKELDDWREDMKAHLKSKIRRKDDNRMHDKQAEENRTSEPETTTAQDRWADSVRSRVDKSTAKQPLGNRDMEEENTRKDLGFDKRGGMDSGLGKDSVTEKAGSPGKIGDNVVEDIRGTKYMEKRCKGRGKEEEEEEEVDFYEEPSKEVEDPEGTVFEGPKLEPEEYDVFVESMRPSETDECINAGKEADQVGCVYPRERDDSDVEDAGELKPSRSKHCVVKDERAVTRKRKEKSRSKEVRTVDEEEEREKRKERHRRHRKKHRIKGENEKDEDEEDNDEIGVHKERRRHKRKHRKEDEDERRERKKRKHRTRGKSDSNSAGESCPADREGTDEDRASPTRRISSSRYRKRRKDLSKIILRDPTLQSLHWSLPPPVDALCWDTDPILRKCIRIRRYTCDRARCTHGRSTDMKVRR